MNVNEDIAYEVTELRAEVARHHRDFEAIREHLDWYEQFIRTSGDSMKSAAGGTLASAIRGIVG